MRRWWLRLFGDYVTASCHKCGWNMAGRPGKVMPAFTRHVDTHEQVAGMTNMKTPTAHLDDLPWHQAPVPPNRHDCKPQTAGFVEDQLVQRCACGALRIDLQPDNDKWIERNRRKSEGDR